MFEIQNFEYFELSYSFAAKFLLTIHLNSKQAQTRIRTSEYQFKIIINAWRFWWKVEVLYAIAIDLMIAHKLTPDVRSAYFIDGIMIDLKHNFEWKLDTSTVKPICWNLLNAFTASQLIKCIRCEKKCWLQRDHCEWLISLSC